MDKYLLLILLIVLVSFFFYDFTVEKMTNTTTIDNSDAFYEGLLAFMYKLKNDEITLTDRHYIKYTTYLIENQNKNINLVKIDTFTYIAKSTSYNKLTLDCLKVIGKNGIELNPCNVPKS